MFMTEPRLSDPTSARPSGRWPPGQRQAPLRPFGFVRNARWQPGPISHPVFAVTGAIAAPVVCDVEALIRSLGRREQRSDLHCVATWSALDLTWSGLAFADFWGWLGEQADLDGVTWLRLTGADGFRTCLPVTDALAPDVLLADRLNGEPLSVDHGAPVRLVAPAHYGYKNIKHLQAMTLRTSYRPGSAGWAEHPRARVAEEERGRGLPGWVYRHLYRTIAPAAFAAYDRNRRV